MEEISHIVRPPFDWHIKDKGEGRLIHLVGPYKDKWQDKASELLLASDPSLYISNPTNDKWPDAEEMIARIGTDNLDYVRAEWETAHIRTASNTGGVLFWFSGKLIDDEAQLPRAMFNFAEWFTHKKYRMMAEQDRPLHIAIGIDDDFAERDYLVYRIFNDVSSSVVATTLEDTCSLMLEALNTK